MESRWLPQRISCCPKHFWSCTRKISLPTSHTILMNTLLLITHIHNFVQLCTLTLLLVIQFSQDLTWGMIELSLYMQWSQQRAGDAQYHSWKSPCCTSCPTSCKAFSWFIATAWAQTDLGKACSLGGVLEVPAWFRFCWRRNPAPV